MHCNKVNIGEVAWNFSVTSHVRVPIWWPLLRWCLWCKIGVRLCCSMLSCWLFAWPMWWPLPRWSLRPWTLQGFNFLNCWQCCRAWEVRAWCHPAKKNVTGCEFWSWCRLGTKLAIFEIESSSFSWSRLAVSLGSRKCTSHGYNKAIFFIAHGFSMVCQVGFNFQPSLAACVFSPSPVHGHRIFKSNWLWWGRKGQPSVARSWLSTSTGLAPTTTWLLASTARVARPSQLFSMVGGWK